MGFIHARSFIRVFNSGELKATSDIVSKRLGSICTSSLKTNSRCMSSSSINDSQSGRTLPVHVEKIQSKKTTSGICNFEYASRRHQLMKNICSKSPKSPHIVIMPGISKRYMIDKIPFLFRQDTDMRYLSGCVEPDCVLVMHTTANGSNEHHKTVMFSPAYDPSQEKWDGPRTSPTSASQVWGVENGIPLAELERYLHNLRLDLKEPIVWYPAFHPPNPTLHEKLTPFLLSGHSVQSPQKFLHQLRLIKSAAEIELMRKTCLISAEAIKETMKATTTGMHEHQLFATVDYHCRMKGAEHLAYPPVVAGGPRANYIHYITNNQQINANEMVLMDAGAEYKGYSGDVTRTWPISGRFTPAQKTLYEAVLEVQKHVILACVERPSIDRLFAIMCTKLGTVLQDLSLLPSNLEGAQLARAAFGFCPHHVSHFLGMDVHDTPMIDRTLPLRPGTILTVEPGIYINENNSAVPQEFTGIGIRLEDDILITETGVEVLTSACPTELDQVEAIVGTA